MSERVAALEAVAEAAKAEVLAQGYRSSDMARALQSLDGEFWFEGYVPAKPLRCGYKVTSEMDDGPLIQRCVRSPHGAEVSHLLGPPHGATACGQPEPAQAPNGSKAP